MLENMIIHKDSNLIDVMKAIGKNNKGAVFIVDDSQKAIGVITDGDIRRAIINDHSVDTKVKDILHPAFVFGRKNEKHDELVKKITESVKIIPILDDKHHILDFFEFKQYFHFPVASPNLSGNELTYLTDAFLSTWISSTGEYINRLESEFSSFCGMEFGAAVSNGTTALHLALLALDIGPGDEVIVPNLTFAATANAVLYCGATPVLVDIEEDSWCIDPKEIKKHISTKTKAIIPVHLFGQPAQMDEIMNIAEEFNLFIVEDCAQAHGAEFNGKRIGSFGHISCFSFFGNKIITTGEGGICLTNDPHLYEKIKVFRDHGMNKQKRYWHDVLGYNYRMTNLQAAIGCAQVERIEEILKERKACEEKYRNTLKDLEYLELQKNDLNKRNKVTWLVSLILKKGNRDQLITALKDKGIDARPFFFPLGVMDMYKEFTRDCPVSMDLAQRGLSLPTKSLDSKSELMMSTTQTVIREFFE